MSLPFIPNDVADPIMQAGEDWRNLVDSQRANSVQAHIAAARIAAYRFYAPQLPAGAYSSLAQAGVDPTSAQFKDLTANYIPNPQSNTIKYDRSGIPALLKQVDAQFGKNDAGRTRIGPLQQLYADASTAEEAGFYKEAIAQARAANGVEKPNVDAGDPFKAIKRGDIGEAITGSAKMVVQPAAAALSYPWEVGENLLYGTGAKRAGQSSDTPWADMFWSGTTLGNLGAEGGSSRGWLPGAAGAAAAQRQVGIRGTNAGGEAPQNIGGNIIDAAAKIPGVNTIMRDNALMPGEENYNLATGVAEFIAAVKLDPMNVAFAKYHDAATLPQTFDVVKEARGAGAINGLRKMVNPTRFDDYANTADAQLIGRILSDEASPSKIVDWLKLEGKPNGLSLAHRLANTTDQGEVMQILRDAAGTDLPYVPKYSAMNVDGVGYRVKAKIPSPRVGGMLPHGSLDLRDLDGAYVTVKRIAENAKLGDVVTRRYLDDLAEIATEPRQVVRRSRLANLNIDLHDAIGRKAAGRGWWAESDARSFARGLVRDVRDNPGMADAHVRTALAHAFPEIDITDDLVTSLADRAILGAGGAAEREAAILGELQATSPFQKQYVSGSVAKKLSTFVKRSDAEMRSRALDADGGIEHIQTGWDRATGAAIMEPIVGPWQIHDLATHAMPIANPVAIRRNVSAFTNILDADPKSWKNLSLIANREGEQRSLLRLATKTSAIWKQSTIGLNPRLLARTAGEAQMAASLAGRQTAFSHPLEAIMRVIRGDTSLNFKEQLFLDGEARAAFGLMGTEKIVGSPLARDGFSQTLRGFTRYNRVDDGEHFILAHAEELSRQSTEPVARAVAEAKLLDAEALAARRPGAPFNPTENIDQVVERYHTGDLAKYRVALGETPGLSDSQFRANLASGSRDGAQWYVDALSKHLDDLTVGEADLLEVVARGTHRGEDFAVLGTAGKHTNNFKKDFLDQIETLKNEGRSPLEVRGRIKIRGPQSGGGGAKKALDTATDYMFNKVIDGPMERWFAQPIMADAYMAEVKRLLPGASESQVRQIANASLDNADEAAALREFATPASPSGVLTGAEVDFLARSKAVETFRGLVYDAHEKSQIGSMVAMLIPFADVFREEALRWTRLGAQNAPRVLRRIDETHKVGMDSGIFAKDPKSGEEMLHIPIPSFVQDQVMPVNVPGLAFNEPIKNLTMFTQGLPGIGLVLSIPAAEVLRKIDDWTGVDLSTALMPFGAQRTGVKSFLMAFAPKYADSLMNSMSGENAQVNANNMAASVSYLASHFPEKYPNSPAGHEKLLEDANEMARGMWVMTAIGQATLPASPRLSMPIFSDDGGVEAYQISQDYRKSVAQAIASGGSTSDAVNEFISKYGEMLLPSMREQYGDEQTLDAQGNPVEDKAVTMARRGASGLLAGALPITTPAIHGLAPTRSTNEFRKNNPDLVRDFKNIWPLLAGAPQGKGGQFYMMEYLTEKIEGERVALKPAQRMELADVRIGQMIFDNYRNRYPLTPNDQQRAELKRVEEMIAKEHPGWAKNGGNIPNWSALKIPREEAVKELIDAANDPRLKNNEAMQGVRAYGYYRDQALRALGPNGEPADPTSFQNKGADQIRAELRRIADLTARKYPAFANIWDKMLMNEIRDPETGPQ